MCLGEGGKIIVPVYLYQNVTADEAIKTHPCKKNAQCMSPVFITEQGCWISSAVLIVGVGQLNGIRQQQVWLIQFNT